MDLNCQKTGYGGPAKGCEELGLGVEPKGELAALCISPLFE